MTGPWIERDYPPDDTLRDLGIRALEMERCRNLKADAQIVAACECEGRSSDDEPMCWQVDPIDGYCPACAVFLSEKLAWWRAVRRFRSACAKHPARPDFFTGSTTGVTTEIINLGHLKGEPG